MFERILKNKNELDSIFYPKSICVIGASNDISKIGGYIFSQIKTIDNITAYPINFKWEEIQGIKSYQNVREIKKTVDLAIVAIPSSVVIETIKDCIKAKIKNLVIITAGFKETGEEGLEREKEIRELVKENNLNLIGPNCLGILNPEIALNCSFAKDIPQSGSTALISQSGAVIDAIIDWSFKGNIGFSKIVSLGNMAGVDELSILEYLKDDSKTKSIVFYMETLERGAEFAKILKEISKIKPVIIIKPGNSDNAKKAIGSHTGSLAQDNILVKTLIEENNGILVENLDEIFNILIALKGKAQKNNKLVIVTNAGGPGVIATDILEKSGFELYKFSKEEKESFNFLPQEASINNPIDVLGDAKSDRYQKTIEKLEEFEEIGNILVLLTPQIMTDSENIAKAIEEVCSKSKKNIHVCFLGSKRVSSGIDILNKGNIPNYSSPSAAIKAMNYLLKYKNFKYIHDTINYNFNLDKINIVTNKIKDKTGLLDYNLTKEIMEVFAIGLPDKIIVKNFEEILKVKLNPTKKYVLKGDSKDLIHKKDVGGVVLNIDINNYKLEIEDMFDRLDSVSSEFTITIEEQVEGIECILGLKSDKELGNFVMFGMGGTYVSVFKDINFGICPLNKTSAKALIGRSKVFELLNGFRGTKPVHFNHLYEIVVRMSYLQEIFPQIKEVDLNPIMCSPEGIYLVDVKLILE